MNRLLRSIGSVLGGTVVIAGIVLVARHASTQPAPPVATAANSAAAAPRSNPKPSAALPPAEHLRIRVAPSTATAPSLLDPTNPQWAAVAPTSILLTRAPRIYPNEPKLDAPPPSCEARALRAGGQLVVSLRWTDATQDVPAAPSAKTGGGGGEPSRLYHRDTDHPSSFPDAAAVMVPDAWSGPSFPSLMMGDAKDSATLYYWNGSRGGAVLSATGRTTVRPMPGVPLAHRASYDAGHWTVTMSVPDQPDGYPLAFALWDGAQGNRDGLKFFSVWYVLAAGDGPKK